jgi:SAM-dependent methyltransferase
MSSRWDRTDAPRGDAYDEQWRALEASGQNPHGEADLVETLLHGLGTTVLDAGCGTGRVAIELARRGFEVCGADLDRGMLATARAKAPGIEWIDADLALLDLRDAAGIRRRFDVVVMAGNVMIFVEPGREADVVARVAEHTSPGGVVVAGFQLQVGRLPLAEYDRYAAAAGLDLVDRWSTWDRAPFVAPGTYAVSVHRRAPDPAPRSGA